MDLIFRLSLVPLPSQVPLEEVHEALRQEDLLHRVQHHGNLYVRHRQGVCMRPHGRYQRDPEALRFCRTAETDGNCLSLGYLPDSEGSAQDVWKPLAKP